MWLVGLAAGLVQPAVLKPGEPVQLKVLPGDTHVFKFSCDGRPADVQVNLLTFCQACDPLLLLSKSEEPSFDKHDASSFDTWKDSTRAHFVQASEVGPDGGMVAVVNVDQFSHHPLEGELHLECAEILAFDFLFWDDVKDPLCPRTDATGDMCSGYGTCTQDNECLCEMGRAGPACGAKTTDLTVAANGHFSNSLKNGEYQYFKVKLPAHFPGGVLDVKVASKIPLVVLVRDKEFPDKGHYDFSNFAEWVAASNVTTLHVPLPPVDMPEAAPRARRLTDSVDCNGDRIKVCETACMTCMRAISVLEGGDACATCDECVPDLSACGPESCTSPDTECGEGCEECMDCVHSNDAKCKGCTQCESCLPWAAKCGPLSSQPPAKVHYYVGVFNHGLYWNYHPDAQFTIDVNVVEGVAAPEPSSLMSEVFDPFRSIDDLKDTVIYPPDKKFTYRLSIRDDSETTMQVNLFKDRPTLIQVFNLAVRHYTDCTFPPGAPVKRVLTSGNVNPKTLFDFQAVAYTMPTAKILSIDTNIVWFAIFATQDAKVNLVFKAEDAPRADTSAMKYGHAVLMLQTILVCACVIMSMYACVSQTAKRVEPFTPNDSLLYRDGTHGEDAELIDSFTERQHMHRGGLGDDGI